jgi:hypothetical protein
MPSQHVPVPCIKPVRSGGSRIKCATTSMQAKEVWLKGSGEAQANEKDQGSNMTLMLSSSAKTAGGAPRGARPVEESPTSTRVISVGFSRRNVAGSERASHQIVQGSAESDSVVHVGTRRAPEPGFKVVEPRCDDNGYVLQCVEDEPSVKRLSASASVLTTKVAHNGRRRAASGLDLTDPRFFALDSEDGQRLSCHVTVRLQRDWPAVACVDSGAAYSMLSEKFYKCMGTGKPILRSSPVALHGTGGEDLAVAGEITVEVSLGKLKLKQVLLVGDLCGPDLLLVGSGCTTMVWS